MTLEKGRVLVVEDNRDILQLIREVLALDGFAVTGCTNGAEALPLLLEQQFDLVITDINMPVMDGVTFLEKVETFPPEHRPVRMVLTGAALRDEMEKRLSALDLFLVMHKPFDVNELTERCREAVSLRARQG